MPAKGQRVPALRGPQALASGSNEKEPLDEPGGPGAAPTGGSDESWNDGLAYSSGSTYSLGRWCAIPLWQSMQVLPASLAAMCFL